MTAPELDILHALPARLDRLQFSVANDLKWLGTIPPDLDAFETMESHRESAARAVLKSFEHIRDQLARAFRAMPRILGEDSERWFVRDYADFMEGLGALEPAAAWTPIVKLRNLLVHDYPLDPQVQFARFIEAVGYLPMLAQVHRQLRRFAHDVLPSKLP